MTYKSVSKQFPDVIYELSLRISHSYPEVPTLVKERKLARLEGDIYHKPGGFKTGVEVLNRISRNDRGSRPSRFVICLEADITENIERMRKDIMLEIEHRLEQYEGFKTLFSGDLTVEEDNDLHPVIKKELEESPSP